MQKSTFSFSITFLTTTFISLIFGVYVMASGYDGKVQINLGAGAIQVQIDGTGQSK